MYDSMDIPVDAEAHCTDGRSGKTAAVIVNPLTKKLTYVVIHYEGKKYLVPRESVSATTPDLIVLTCTRKELKEAAPFSRKEFLNVALPDLSFDGDYFVEPFVGISEDDIDWEDSLLVEEELIPKGQLAIRRGNEVCASDGPVGVIDEFVVNRQSGEITHLVLREGHLWGKRDITIPIGDIEKIDENIAYLKQTKEYVASQPAIRVDRWWD